LVEVGDLEQLDFKSKTYKIWCIVILMNMKEMKRAVLYGALLWVLIFFEVSILMFGIGLKNDPYYVIHYMFAVLLVAIVTALYFKKRKANFEKGVLAGVVFAITGILLDLVITVPLFVRDYSLMFLDFMLWAGIVLGIITAGIVGAIKEKKG